MVRKKAALCLLRLFRRNPDVLNKEDWCAPTCGGLRSGRAEHSSVTLRADAFFSLLDERDFGLLTSVLSFLSGLVASDPLWCETCAMNNMHVC